MTEDVLNFGRFISIATTALAVITANRRQRRRAVLGKASPRDVGTAMYKGFLGGDRFHSGTLDVKLQNDPLHF